MNIYYVNILSAICCLVVGYFFGAIPNGVIIGKIFFHKDPRDFGSGNSGGTNSGRVLGKKIGAVVILLDMLKAVIPMISAWAIFTFTSLHEYYIFGQWDLSSLYYWLAGLSALIGHCWPVYIKFKGGKAVACFMGLAVFTSWFFLLVCVFYIVTLKAKKMVSLASIIGGLFQVIAAWAVYLVGQFTSFNIQNLTWTFALGANGISIGLWYAIAMTIGYLIIIIRHHSNITRIKEGNENKVTWIK